MSLVSEMNFWVGDCEETTLPNRAIPPIAIYQVIYYLTKLLNSASAVKDQGQLKEMDLARDT